MVTIAPLSLWLGSSSHAAVAPSGLTIGLERPTPPRGGRFATCYGKTDCVCHFLWSQSILSKIHYARAPDPRSALRNQRDVFVNWGKYGERRLWCSAVLQRILCRPGCHCPSVAASSSPTCCRSCSNCFVANTVAAHVLIFTQS